jgi:ATP-dependent DNA helicase RecQ
MMLRRCRDVQQIAARTTGSTGESPESNQALFDVLRALRRRLAKERNVPPYIIFPDRTLQDMAVRMPVNEDAMRMVHGVGEAKLAAYGEFFIQEIRSFLASLPDCIHSENTAVPPVVRRSVSQKVPGATIESTWEYLRQGMSTADIATHRGLSEKTIVEHICQIILDGRPVEIDRYVDREICDHVAALLPKMKTGLLRELVDAATIPISFEQAKLARAWLEIQSVRGCRSQVPAVN